MFSSFSELQPGFAGRVGERLDAAVVEVSVAVEDDLVDALARGRASAISRADLLGRVGLVVLAEAPLDVLRQRRGVRERLARRRRRRPARRCACALRKTREARTLRRPADLAADTELAALSPDDFMAMVVLATRDCYFTLLAALAGLARLLADLLALVANALAAVRLRRTERRGSSRRSDRSTSLSAPVRMRSVPFESPGISHLDAFRHREVHRVREAERRGAGLALHLGAVAGADELERLRRSRRPRP